MSIGNEFEVKRLTKENEELKKKVSTHEQLIGDLQSYIGHLKKGREFGLYSAIVNAFIIKSVSVGYNFSMELIRKENITIIKEAKMMMEQFDDTIYPNKLDFTKEKNDA
jgi:hypothetical protein